MSQRNLVNLILICILAMVVVNRVISSLNVQTMKLKKRETSKGRKREKLRKHI